MNEAPTKLNGDILQITFSENSNPFDVTRMVLNAFLRGVMMFKFQFKFHQREFKDCVCMPQDATEADAIEMAKVQYSRFRNTVAKVLN